MTYNGSDASVTDISFAVDSSDHSTPLSKSLSTTESISSDGAPSPTAAVLKRKRVVSSDEDFSPMKRVNRVLSFDGAFKNDPQLSPGFQAGPSKAEKVWLL